MSSEHRAPQRSGEVEGGSREPLAIVGIGALFPKASSAEAYWKLILEGVDAIGDVPPAHWLVDDYFDPDKGARDRIYARRGGFLSKVEMDLAEWGIPPALLPATDPSQLLALLVARACLEDVAGPGLEGLRRERVSVILGASGLSRLATHMGSRMEHAVWAKALREAGLDEGQVRSTCDRIASSFVEWSEGSFPGLLGNVIAGRIANRLNLGGTNLVTDAACGSSLAAVHAAARELWIGDSDLVVTGGVDTLNNVMMYTCFSKTPALSPSQDCRPYSAQGDGTLLGEGLGMVALERLSDAERNGHRIYALLRSVGASSDGREKSIYAPSPAGQALAIRRAQAQVGIGPETVELVEGHGTGTAAGDAAECAGLRIAFEGADRADKPWCALGSVKSQIGHTKGAAGAAGIIKAAFALRHRVLPRTLKVDAPNPALELGRSPFYLSTRNRPWMSHPGHPRRAGVSSFGFGGSNFHALLEEYRGDAALAGRIRVTPDELVVLTAASRPELVERCAELQRVSGEPGALAHLAHATRRAVEGRAEVRLAIVATDEADLTAKLKAAAALAGDAPQTALPPGVYLGEGEPDGDLAFLFPGQGSQYPEMAAELVMAWEAARQPWDLAASLRLDPTARLHDVAFPPPSFGEPAARAQAERLTATEWAQPAIAAASLSWLAVLDALGVRPAAVAGHSFGELTALHAAGVFGADDLLRLARRRGELMRDAGSRPGAMTAVAASAEQVRSLLAAQRTEVVIANHNAPQQVVVSGAVEAIVGFEHACAGAGVSCQRLPVATAFHSPIVADSRAPFASALAEVAFREPRTPVLSGAMAAPYPAAPARIQEVLAQQIAEPVRFVEVVEALHARGVRTFLEVGPASVLTSLVGRILAGKPHRAIALDARRKHAVSSLHHALATLAAAGVTMKLDALWREYRAPADPRSRKPARMPVWLDGALQGVPRSAEPRREVVEALRSARRDSPDREARAGRTAMESKMQPGGNGVEARVVGAAGHRNGAASMPAAPALPSVEALPADVGAGGPKRFGGVQAVRTAAPHAPPSIADGRAGHGPLAEAHIAFQSAMVEAQTSFQRSMAECHAAFLAAASGQAAPRTEPLELGPVPHRGALAPAGDWEGRADESGPVVAAWMQPPAAAPEMEGVTRVAREPGLPLTRSGARAKPPARPAPEARPAPVPLPAEDAAAAVRAVIADRTGYPTELLRPETDLETDLGVDSLKRVEILAALAERIPALDKQEASFAGLRTIREIGEVVAGMTARSGGATPAPAAEAPEAAPPSPALALAPAAPTGAPPRAEDLVLSIVAAKTGYPPHLLKLGTDLETDLGVDSLKRVEILTALTAEVPGVDAQALALTRTIGELVNHLEPPGTKGAASPAPAAVSAAPGAVPPVGEAQRELDPDAGGEGIPFGRFAVRERPASAAGFGAPGLRRATRIVVTDEGAGVAEALVGLLRQEGLAAEVGRGPVAADADAVILLAGLRACASREEAVAATREAFEAARSVAVRFGERGGIFVGVQDAWAVAGEGADPRRAWLAGIAGVVKSARWEWPKAHVRAIEIERGSRGAEEIACAVLDELLRGGAEVEILLRSDGRRTTTVLEPADAVEGDLPLGRDDFLVASGGARGVTAQALVALAARAPCRMLLLGRTVLEREPEACHGVEGERQLIELLGRDAEARGDAVTPAALGERARRIVAVREIEATLEALARAGAIARYAAVDVTDPRQVERAIARQRAEWGPVTCLVHGAGVIADRLLEDKTADQFDRVFGTKVLGLASLLDATKKDPVRVLVGFSSLSGRLGCAGQSDYAAANEVVTRVLGAESTRRSGLRARSLAWGPWRGGMVKEHLARVYERDGIRLISAEEGGRWLVRELGAQGPQAAEVVLGAAHAAIGDRAVPALGGDVQVTRAGYPHIEDHQIKGAFVVPLVQVVEWFARLGRAARPDLHFAGCDDVQVLQGIKLRDFHGGGDLLHVEVRPKLRALQGGAWAAMAGEIRGDEPAVVHYRGTVCLLREVEARPGAPERPGALEAWSGAPYGSALFHGPRFQVLVPGRIEVGAAGAEALLRGGQDVGWAASDAWVTDPALLDGALQLAGLWVHARLGTPSVPTGLRSLRLFRGGLQAGTFRAVLTAREVRGPRCVADVAVLDEAGQLLAELRGVEMHAYGEASRPA